MGETVIYRGNPAMFRNEPFAFIVGCVLCLLIAGIPIMVVWWLRCKYTELTVSDQRTTLRRGILSKNINEVWHRDVRNVQVCQTLLQRILSTGTLAISSAGQADVEINVTGIRSPYSIKNVIDDAKMEYAHR